MRAYDVFLALRKLPIEEIQGYIENNRINLKAIGFGDNAVLHYCLDSTYNSNVLTDGNIALVRELLRCGARPNILNGQWESPIQLAYNLKETQDKASNSLRWKLIAELLRAGPDPNAPFKKNNRNLMNMVLTNEIFNWSHKTGCYKTPDDMRRYLRDSWDPRHLDDDLSYIVELIYKNATIIKVDLNAIDFMGKSLLALATYNGFIKTAEKLLELGANVNGEQIATEKSDASGDVAEGKPVKEKAETPLVDLINNIDYPEFLADFRRPAIELLIRNGARRPSTELLDSAPGWIMRAFNDRDMLVKSDLYSPLRDLKLGVFMKDGETQTNDADFTSKVNEEGLQQTSSCKMGLNKH